MQQDGNRESNFTVTGVMANEKEKFKFLHSSQLNSENEMKREPSPAFKKIKPPMLIEDFGDNKSGVSGIPVVSAIDVNDRNLNNADFFSDTMSRSKKQVRFTNLYDGSNLSNLKNMRLERQ